LMFKNQKVTALIEGNHVMLVYKGVVNKESLLREKITEDELEAVVREHGVIGTSDVELAILERDGNISIVSKNLPGQTFHKPRRKLHPKHQKSN